MTIGNYYEIIGTETCARSREGGPLRSQRMQHDPERSPNNQSGNSSKP
ncbi:MAG TPA: hypothetical protein VKN18_01640 [Blastocatellia bacterium]|nr:hypothetical protein [Blastocatellia bacterium]